MPHLLYPIYCMCTQYTVCVPNILHTIPDMRRDDRERLKGGGGDLFVVPCEGLDRRMIAQIPYLRERDREREREGERERGGWGGKGVATVEQASEGFDHKNEQRERARRTLNPKPKPQSRHSTRTLELRS